MDFLKRLLSYAFHYDGEFLIIMFVTDLVKKLLSPVTSILGFIHGLFGYNFKPSFRNMAHLE